MVTLVPKKPKNHYEVEDTPPDSLETQLDMRDSAATSMQILHERSTHIVQNAQESINIASEIVTDIRKWAKQTKQNNLVSATGLLQTAHETMWNALRELYNTLESARQLETNDKAVIDTQLQQIEELAGELEIINGAIENADTGNHRFEPLMRVAREEITEDAQTVGYENAEFALYADVQHFINYLTGIDNYDVANRLISLISGTLQKVHTENLRPTRDEIKCLKKLIEAVEAQCIASDEEGEE